MKKRNLSALLFVLVLVAAALLFWKQFGPKPQNGSKTITVTVIHGDESKKIFVVSTNAESLRGALEQENLISGNEGQFGLFVETADGETVDTAAEEWWSFERNGELLTTGVDDTMIVDGDTYEIALKTGYDW